MSLYIEPFPEQQNVCKLYGLPSAAHAAFGSGWAEHLVGLHHAAVGEAAVIFIRVAAPWEVGRGTSAATRLGELGCTIEVPGEEIHGTF